MTVRVVTVVGREQRSAQVARQADELRVDARLFRQPVVLQLDEERVAAEHRLEAVDELARAGVVVGEQTLRHRAAETSRGGDQTLRVLLEQLEVDARLVVVAVEVRVRRDLDEVAVSLGGLGEDREVVDVVVVATRPVEPARGDHVGLGADDGRETGVARGAVEVDDAVHVPVVGDADRGLTVGRGGGHHVLDAGRAVEHRVLGVQMEMDERLAHRPRRRLPIHRGGEIPVDKSH